MRKTAEPQTLALAPEDSKLIGVQFIGLRMDRQLLWPEGEYEFELLGWISREPRDREVDLKTSFRVEITRHECDFLRYWAAVSERTTVECQA
jgi:hypothetical protein